MPATRTRHSFVLFLLTVHQLLMGMTANHHQKSAHKTFVNSVKPDSHTVNEEEEQTNTARHGGHNLAHTDTDVEHNNLTHGDKDMEHNNLTHGDKDMGHNNLTDTDTDVEHNNLTHTANMHTDSRSPYTGSGDKIENNVAQWNGQSTTQRSERYNKHVIGDAVNLTSEWENLTDIQQEPGSLGNVSHHEAYRTPQHIHRNPGMKYTDPRSQNDSRSKLPSKDNQQLGHVNRSPPATGANTENRVKSTLKDWFLRLTKRFNSPSWLIRQLDTFEDTSTNQTGPLSADSESAVNLTRTWSPDHNSIVSSGGNNWTGQWPQVNLPSSRQTGLSDSRLENHDNKLTTGAYGRGSRYARQNSLDNGQNGNAGQLLDTELLTQPASDPRMNVSEHAGLPAVDNSSMSANFFDYTYFNSTADKVLASLAKCPSCRGNALLEDRVKGIRLNMFKNLLAQKLQRNVRNLSHTSGSSLHKNIPIIPQSLLEQTLRDNAREYERDEFHARDQEVIIAGDDMGRDCIKLHATGCYSFRLKGRFQADVAEAQLWLYKMEDPGDITGQTFTLYELQRLKSGRVSHSSMIASVDTLTTQGWVVLNITRSLRKWLDKRKATKVIAIRCVTCVNRGHRALYGAKHGYKPLLIAKFEADKSQVRDKRSMTCDPRYECCKRELEVNFNDIGMIEIMQPKRLSVGYCFGVCNEIHQTFRTNHTYIRHRLLWSQPLADSVKQQLMPCCVPVVLKDITILTYEGDGTILVKLLTKVVVETCGCL